MRDGRLAHADRAEARSFTHNSALPQRVEDPHARQIPNHAEDRGDRLDVIRVWRTYEYMNNCSYIIPPRSLLFSS